MERDRENSNLPSEWVPPTHTFDPFPPADDSFAAHDTTATNRPSGVTPTPFLPDVPGYDTVGFIGEGGMGHVFHAHDRQHKRDVAIKLLRFGEDTPYQWKQRFVRETKILKKLDHPHVVRVYDSGEWKGYPYYVMRYVPTGSLVRQTETVRTSARRVVEFLAKVAAAVHYVHERGVLHRDLKPGNILVDERGDPLLVDFGIARYDDGHTVTTGVALLGTPAYMAPELIAVGPEASRERSDVWAVGVILYELLAGRRPFLGQKSDPELYERIKSHAPPWFADCQDILPDADLRLETICLKCLAKDPARRYQTAGELAADLTAWLSGEPLTTVENTPEVRRAAGGGESMTVAGTTLTAGAGRRKWRWLVAIGLLVATAAVAIVASPAVPWWKKTKKPSIAERLDAPEKFVEFVSENGRLLEDAGSQVPGFDAEGTTKRDGPDGYIELSSSRKYLLELGDEPLPFPYQLELEVRWSPGPKKFSRCGGYVERQTHPQVSGGFVHVAFVNEIRAFPPDEAAGAWDGRIPALATVARIDPGDRSSDSTGFTYFPSTPTPVPGDPPKDDTPGEFRRLVIHSYPDHFRAWSCGVELKPRNRTILAGLIRSAFQTHDEKLHEPPFGSGFGLFVEDGDCQFRSVRLRRLP